MEVEMHINDLAEFMYLKNINDAKVEMSLGGIEDTKDLFFFCLDLFCKGLVLLFGTAERKVSIQDISLDQFQVIKKKLGNAGIAVTLEVFEDIDMGDEAQVPGFNIQEIESNPPLPHLKDYNFRVRFSNTVYQIVFDLVQ